MKSKNNAELLNLQNKLLESILIMQKEFTGRGIYYGWCKKTIENLLYLSESEFGFICELLKKDDGTPYIKSHGITNIAWDDKTCLFYEENKKNGLEFFNFESLWGKAVTTGEPVIANDPDNDDRRGGYPKENGHPILKTFLAIPIKGSGGNVVGVMGVANRPNGYDNSVADFLSPFVSSYGLLIEKYQTEEALKESEKLYKTIIQTTVDGFWVTDAEENILQVNDAYCKMSGYSRDELLSMRIYNMEVNDREEITKRTHEIVEKGAIRFETRHRRKDGSTFDIEVSLQSVSEKQDLFFSFMCDITERKRSEETLSARLQFEHIVSKISSELAGMSSKKEIDEQINKALASIGEFSGADRAYVFLFRNENKIIENTHEWCSDHVKPQIENLQNISIDKELPWFSKQLKEQKVFQVHDLMSMPSEARLEQQHFSMQGIKSLVAVPMKLGPKLIGFLGFDAVREHKKWDDDYLILLRFIGETFANVIERIHSEENLKKIQSQLSNAIEIANLGPWEYDVATDTFTFNDYFYRIFRTTVEDAGGYRMKPEEYAKRFVHPDDIPRVREETRKAIETKEPDYKTSTEHRIIYPDGTTGYVSVQIFVVKDDRGNTIKTYGVNQDITEFKRLEGEFLKSQKMESIGTLAGGIAHDFNNILTAILGNITLARDLTCPETEIYEFLGDAEKASKRAQALTKQLLTFAKGGMPVKEIASIKEIIKESALFVTRGAKSRCEFSIAEDLWSGEVDPGQINQVINNIVINANQAMPEGGIIRINADNVVLDEANAWKLKPGRYIRISIKDEGIGISEKYLSKIFDPYFSTKQEGSGLGLATSYSIINNHGGFILPESVLGEGTTFHIYLPASGKQVFKEEERNVIKGEGKILVMDDEPSVRKLLERMLDRLGYEAETAEDGVEAIEIYMAAKESGKPFNAVIFDLTIPGGMGGKEALHKLKEIDPEVKAIVSSGYSEDPVMADYEAFGFKGIVPKPFGSKLLSKVLHEVLNLTL